MLTITDAAWGRVAEYTTLVEVSESISLRVGSGQGRLDLLEVRRIVDGLHVHVVEDLEANALGLWHVNSINTETYVELRLGC